MRRRVKLRLLTITEVTHGRRSNRSATEALHSIRLVLPGHFVFCRSDIGAHQHVWQQGERLAGIGSSFGKPYPTALSICDRFIRQIASPRRTTEKRNKDMIESLRAERCHEESVANSCGTAVSALTAQQFMAIRWLSWRAISAALRWHADHGRRI